MAGLVERRGRQNGVTAGMKLLVLGPLVATGG